MMFVGIVFPTLALLCAVECRLFPDVPDNVQLRKDSDINLMKVLESLAPVTADEGASLQSDVDGIERFRRRVAPANSQSEVKAAESVFDEASGGPHSGDGEFDSGNGVVGSYSKKSEVSSGESANATEHPIENVSDASGMELQYQADPAPKYDPLHPPTSDTTENPKVKLPHPNTPLYLPQPPPPPPSQPLHLPPPPPVIVTTTIKQIPVKKYHTGDIHQSRFSQPPKVKVHMTTTSEAGSGVSADEAAFISALHNDNEAKAEAPQVTVLPGSVGAVDDQNEDTLTSGDDASASGQDSDNASGSNDAVEPNGSGGESEDSSDNDASSAAEDDDASASGEKREVEVDSGSGINFISGGNDAVDASQDSSGESDSEEDSLPGSLGAVSNIEQIEAREQKETKSDASSGSGDPEVVRPQAPVEAPNDVQVQSTEQQPKEQAPEQLQAQPAAKESEQIQPQPDSETAEDPLMAQASAPQTIAPAIQQSQPQTVVEALKVRPQAAVEAPKDVQVQSTEQQSKEQAPEQVQAQPAGNESEQIQAQSSSETTEDPLMAQASAPQTSAAATQKSQPQTEAEALKEDMQTEIEADPSSGSGASYDAVASNIRSLPGSEGAGEDVEEFEGSAESDASASGQDTIKSAEPLHDSNIVQETPQPRQPITGTVETEVGAESESGSGEAQTVSVESPVKIVTPQEPEAKSDSSAAVQESVPTTNAQITPANTDTKPQEAQTAQVTTTAASGSGSDDLLVSDNEEPLPGSVGAMGPNLMTMNSLDAGSGEDSEEADTSASGEPSGKEFETTDTISSNANKKDSIPAVAASQDRNSAKKTTEGSAVKTEGSGLDLGFPETASGSGVQTDSSSLPGGVGNEELELLAGEDSTSGSTITDSDSGSGAEIEASAVSSGSSASIDVHLGTSKKTTTPNIASTSGQEADKESSADVSSAFGSASGEKQQDNQVAIKPVVMLAGSQKAKQQKALDAAPKILPGSFGIDESISSTGSGLSETSASLDSEASGNTIAEDQEQLPEIKKTTTEEPEDAISGQEAAETEHDGAGEGSASSDTEETSDESQSSDTNKISYNLDRESALKVALGAAGLTSVPIALGSGMGSGIEIDTSAFDSLSGSGISGTLEFVPVSNPSDAVLNLFGNANKKEKSGGESGHSGIEGSAKQHISGENRHDIPENDSGSEEEAAEEEKEEDEWPKAGDTVDQQMLDHFMISQILEQNMTLFYGGLAGRSGTIGPPGPPGETGDQGMTGNPGSSGTLGDIGAPGSDGTSGIKGPRGPPGYLGFKGERGPSGPPGISGTSGSPGISGGIGYVGPQGPDAIMPNCSYICEGERTLLQCKQYELINIKRAFWGREDKQICNEPPVGLTIDKPCETDTDNALEKINGQCRNEQACELVASNVFFDEPSCKNAYKYLKVCYECVPDSANAVDVLRDYGKRKKRGTKLEHILLKMKQKEEKKVMDDLWQRPFRAPSF